MPRSEESVHEPVTEDTPQLDEAEKGDQHNEQQGRERKDSLPSSTAQVRDAFVERFPMKPTDSGVFGNLATSKDNGEREGLQKSWIDQRSVPELVGKM
jgi:hypothetical protein